MTATRPRHSLSSAGSALRTASGAPTVSAARPTLLVAARDAATESWLVAALGSDFRVVRAGASDVLPAGALSERPDLMLLAADRIDSACLRSCREVRACPDGRTMPIIIVAREARSDDPIRAFAAGADDYLVRSYPAHLRARAHTWLLRAARWS